MSGYENRDESSLSERILRLQDEWDQIAGDAQDMGLSPEQLEEIERRLQDHRKIPGPYQSWEEIRAELEGLSRHDPN